MTRYSDAYITCEADGPFAGLIDPWAEAGYYFQQIHHGMISHLLGQIRRPLRQLGYVAGIEASLQIAEGREPDLHVRQEAPTPPVLTSGRYAEAAEAIVAEPGVEADEPDLQAIHIRSDAGDLVTVVEIISPSNKRAGVPAYRAYRRTLLGRWVNVVEIDATRSRLRLTANSLTTAHPYHIAVHLPAERPRIIGVTFEAPLKRCALPLRSEVVGIEAQAAYDHAYREASIAAQIAGERGYKPENLPFPSLVTADQVQALMTRVEAWREALDRLRG
jgi:hypothetical protein